ncbi:MAG TPA: TIGR02266 family protein [Polyangiaceae bacterium]|nr:TIGR02266 family protein [Polyangiaceae bacterium]
MHAIKTTSPLTQSREPGESGPVAVMEARRAHARHDVELEVTLESETNFYQGLTENLSEGGLFIATHLVRPLGTSIEVSLKLPNLAEPIRAVGTVRWIREYSDTSDTSPGMGVRFEQIEPEQQERIREFVAARPPLFHDED